MGRESLDMPKFERERLEMGRAVSELVWKAEASPPWLRGSDFWSRRLQLDLESSTVFALNAKSRRFLYGLEKVASSPSWSGNRAATFFWSHRLRLGLENRVCALVWKSRHPHCERESRATSSTVAKNVFLVAPSPPCPGKPRRLRLGLENRAFSTLNANIAPLPPKS